MTAEHTMIEGRSCPLHYRRAPEALARPADHAVDGLVIAGGVYGNPEALGAIEALADAEGLALCCNGDVHWFDADARAFRQVEARSARHYRTAGNVEAELAAASGAGCGCAYPATVPDAFVERSNAIMAALHAVAGADARAALGALAHDARFDVGAVRVGVIHGDPESLAGWGLAVEAREADPAAFERCLADWFRRADVDVLACAHTCLPHAMRLAVDGRDRVVINSGAAGLANFRGDTRGLVTRVAPAPSSRALYRSELHGVVVEAVPVDFDLAAWRSRFDRIWPAGSAAALNYAARIVGGPAFSLDRAVGPGFVPS